MAPDIQQGGHWYVYCIAPHSGINVSITLVGTRIFFDSAVTMAKSGIKDQPDCSFFITTGSIANPMEEWYIRCAMRWNHATGTIDIRHFAYLESVRL